MSESDRITDDPGAEDIRLYKVEEGLVEQVKEWLLEHKGIHDYFMDRIQLHWGSAYGFNVPGPVNEIQEELVCQCQVLLMNQLLAKVMVS